MQNGRITPLLGLGRPILSRLHGIRQSNPLPLNSHHHKFLWPIYTLEAGAFFLLSPLPSSSTSSALSPTMETTDDLKKLEEELMNRKSIIWTRKDEL